MIKNNQSKFNLTHVLLDAAVIALSYALAYYIVIGANLGIAGAPGTLPAAVYFRALYIIIPVYLILYVIFLLIPILSTIVPLDSFNELLSQSTLAPIFQSDGFIAQVIAGRIKF